MNVVGLLVFWGFFFLIRHCKAILGWGQPGQMRWNFSMNDATGTFKIDRTTCWPAVQRATTVPLLRVHALVSWPQI